jgi:cob(I)alamin adenosyltransferase
LGAVDEAGAALGLARAHARSPEGLEMLLRIQRDLYGLMAELAATPENAERFRSVRAEQVAWVEAQTDRVASLVKIPREFILPGDTISGAFLDMARVIVRRAERRVAALLHSGAISNPELLRYLNRLSSCCFVMEIRENQYQGNQDISLAKVGKDT